MCTMANDAGDLEYSEEGDPESSATDQSDSEDDRPPLPQKRRKIKDCWHNYAADASSETVKLLLLGDEDVNGHELTFGPMTEHPGVRKDGRVFFRYTCRNDSE